MGPFPVLRCDVWVKVQEQILYANNWRNFKSFRTHEIITKGFIWLFVTLSKMCYSGIHSLKYNVAKWSSVWVGHYNFFCIVRKCFKNLPNQKLFFRSHEFTYRESKMFFVKKNSKILFLVETNLVVFLYSWTEWWKLSKMG